MVVAFPLGASIPAGSVPEHNPVLSMLASERRALHTSLRSVDSREAALSLSKGGRPHPIQWWAGAVYDQIEF